MKKNHYIGVDGNEHPFPDGMTLDLLNKRLMKGLCDKFGVDYPKLDGIKPLHARVVEIDGKKHVVADVD